MVESIAVILGVIFFVIQIRSQTRIARADHDRKKKQSTIEFYNLISSENEVFSDNINKYGNTLDFTSVRYNVVLNKSVKRYLSRLERLAIGVASGIYDFDILNHMSGYFLIRKYYQLEKYIQEVRKVKKRNVYSEFERMIKKLEKCRKEHPNEIISDDIIVKLP